MDWIEQIYDIDELEFATYYLLINHTDKWKLHTNYNSGGIRFNSQNFKTLELGELKLFFNEIMKPNLFNTKLGVNIFPDIIDIGVNVNIFDTCNSIKELINKFKTLLEFYEYINIFNLCWDNKEKKYCYYIGII